jgi:glutamate-ammonia-ligase adenylyltransferase
MARQDESVSLSALARLGFAELSTASAALEELAALTGSSRAALLEGAFAADPDGALEGLLRIARRAPGDLAPLLADDGARSRAWRLFGASDRKSVV